MPHMSSAETLGMSQRQAATAFQVLIVTFISSGCLDAGDEVR
jgi:hypothetical protein